LDSRLTLSAHVASICKSSYFHIKALRHVRSSLPTDVCISLATAMIQSRLDYANSVLYNTSAGNINKLQRIQNTLARTIFQGQHDLPVADLIQNLHWLPIKNRISFKIATITYKLLQTEEPSYLFRLIAARETPRVLRSSNQCLLTQTRTRTTFGSRAFSCAAPQIWNSIPLTIRNSSTIKVFRNNLKTYYFAN